MRISKSQTLSQILDDKDNYPELEEVIVCKNDKPDEQSLPFVVYRHRIRGIFTPLGKFPKLAKAADYAMQVEEPNMIENGYEYIRLHDTCALMVYYEERREDVEDWMDAYNMGENLTTEIGDTSIKVKLLNTPVGDMQDYVYDITRENVVGFVNYLKSEKRRERYEQLSDVLKKGASVETRLRDVSHADVENFLHDTREGIRYT